MIQLITVITLKIESNVNSPHFLQILQIISCYTRLITIDNIVYYHTIKS
jgi:hypothetical protein